MLLLEYLFGRFLDPGVLHPWVSGIFSRGQKNKSFKEFKVGWPICYKNLIIWVET